MEWSLRFDGAVVEPGCFVTRLFDVRGSVLNRGEAIEQNRCFVTSSE